MSTDESKPSGSEPAPKYLSYLNEGCYELEFKEACKLACNGNTEAMFHLAGLYASGRGIECNPEAATQWYEKAAKGGLSIAQYFLGYRYETAQGIEQNINQAEFWYKKAAMQGNHGAMFMLGSLLERFRSEATDKVEALKWYLLSEGGGVIPAKERIRHLQRELQSQDVERAELSSSMLAAQHPDWEWDPNEYHQLLESSELPDAGEG